MDIRWLEAGNPAPVDVAGAVAVYEAVRALEAPAELPMTSRRWQARLTHGWDGEPPEAAVAVDGLGRIVGVLELVVPERDNRHLGWVQIAVDPDARRQGVGRRLFEVAVSELRARGRTHVLMDNYDTPAAAAFASALGLAPAARDVHRRQDVWHLDRTHLGRLTAEAAEAATGYELVHLPVPVTGDLVPAVVRMIEAINDAPTDDMDVEDVHYNAERLDAFYASQAAHNRRLYHLAARRCDSGELAGHTVVAVEEDEPWLAHQEDTSVLSSHRGHRLGLLLKTGMLQWLAQAEPQLRVLDTWNAASNDHMIAVNELLGYRVVNTSTSYQRSL